MEVVGIDKVAAEMYLDMYDNNLEAAINGALENIVQEESPNYAGGPAGGDIE